MLSMEDRSVLLIGKLLVVAGVIPFLLALFGNNFREVDTYCSRFPEPKKKYKEIQTLYNCIEDFGGVIYSEKYLMSVTNPAHIIFRESRDILLVYKHKEINRRTRFTEGYSVRFLDRDGETISTETLSEDVVDGIFDDLHTMCPFVSFGNMEKINFTELAQYTDNKIRELQLENRWEEYEDNLR